MYRRRGYRCMAWFTLRSPKALLYQKDLYAVLAVVLIDLRLTVWGIQEGGSELNPLYRPLTEHSVEAMVAGIAFYVVVIMLLSLVLTGGIRKLLGSFVFGMHVIGTMTWLHLVAPDLHAQFNLFWYATAGTASTALFFYAEDLAASWKKRSVDG